MSTTQLADPRFRYLRARLGQTFEGLVTTVVEYGCFVQLVGLAVDGLTWCIGLIDFDRDGRLDWFITGTFDNSVLFWHRGGRAIFDGIFAKGTPMPRETGVSLVKTRRYRAAHDIGPVAGADRGKDAHQVVAHRVRT